ncbi:MAG: DUF4276 family protein [Pseudomonas sp.]|nr:DUF4276 family protein [Pseudomonas sp.]MDO9618642.1 DUF4276 family protein [Pseudomonas sp.]MDP2447511.1 DUF4276 family protein [Pseudomonas sp.]
MHPRHVALATEDELSEAVGQKLISMTNGKLAATLLLRQGGQGYLYKRIKNFCEMSAHQPVILITDLDNSKHPHELITKWLGKLQKPKQLIIRIAVREIESWVLSDHAAINTLLGKSIGKIPENPDTLADPKSTLLSLAKKAPREIKADLVAQSGTVARQGYGYNRVLIEFIKESWCPIRASERSDSLKRAIHRIQELANNHHQ